MVEVGYRSRYSSEGAHVLLCGHRLFVVSHGLRQAAPAAYTIGNGGFSAHSAARLFLRGRARAAVVRQLKVPLVFGAVLPHGHPNKRMIVKIEAGEQLGSDYVGLISKMEEELCTIEGRGEQQWKKRRCGVLLE